MSAAHAPRVGGAVSGTNDSGLVGPIVVVDDDDEVRELISEVLGRAGLRTIEATSGEDALEAARHERPSLVLLDVCLADTNGYEVCRSLRLEFGDELPIVFTSGQRVESLDRVAGLMLGADDYLVKPFDLDELVVRVRRLVSRSQHTQLPPAERYQLTTRELEILRLLADGNRPKEIARRLVISQKTVSSHMQRLFTKLGVHSQAQAVALAFTERLLADDSDVGSTPPRPARTILA